MRSFKVAVFASAAAIAVTVSAFAANPAEDSLNQGSLKALKVTGQQKVGPMEVPLYDWPELAKPEVAVEEVVAAEDMPIAETFVPAPAVAVNPGSAQDIARNLVLARGWDEAQFSCLYNLWQKESNWRADAKNSSSGAYGIPQSLPGEKMASAGPDWLTNPETQIRWGLSYIEGRYGNPCGAWEHSQSKGWY